MVLKRRLKRAVQILVVLYVMIGASLYVFQEKLLFRPTVLAQDYSFQFSQAFEEVFLKTNDGARLNAIHFKVENPKGVILYFHGNAGDLSRWGLITEYFVEKDYDVFVMDYRTYGKSTGKLSEAVLYSDAQLCFDYLKEQYAESDITLYGRSLGTGIATHLAGNNSPKQLVLESPYYSIADVAQSRFPIFPVKRLLKYQIPTHEFITEVKCPITIFHGTDDAIVPFKSGEKLYTSISNTKVQFIRIESGSHHNLIDFDAYHTTIDKLLP
jgi:fermentation-respiration switch protein FrsA (DUF1100 family)